MMRKIFLFAVAIILFTNMNLLAQNGQDSTNKNCDDEKWLNWKDYEWFHWEFHGKPFMEVNYGFGTTDHKKLKSSFADNGLLEIKLGYASRSTHYSENIIQFSEKYLFGSKLGADLKSSSTVIGEMKSNLWRFGFAKRGGYAYKFNNFSIMPYNSSGFSWSRLDMINYPAQFYLLINPPMSLDDAFNDTEILNRFHDAYRFGTVNEGGIKFDIASSVSFNVSYEAAVIFPRHLVWKHLGSMIIEESAKHFLGNFIDEVSDSSPYATPIVDFLLNNGLSYAFFTLKKDRMNWPFATEEPLTYEMIKFGITVTF